MLMQRSTALVPGCRKRSLDANGALCLWGSAFFKVVVLDRKCGNEESTVYGRDATSPTFLVSILPRPMGARLVVSGQFDATIGAWSGEREACHAPSVMDVIIARFAI